MVRGMRGFWDMVDGFLLSCDGTLAYKTLVSRRYLYCPCSGRKPERNNVPITDFILCCIRPYRPDIAPRLHLGPSKYIHHVREVLVPIMRQTCSDCAVLDLMAAVILFVRELYLGNVEDMGYIGVSLSSWVALNRNAKV